MKFIESHNIIEVDSISNHSCVTEFEKPFILNFENVTSHDAFHLSETIRNKTKQKNREKKKHGVFDSRKKQNIVLAEKK